MSVTKVDVELRPCKYRYGEYGRDTVFIEERDTDRWAITRTGSHATLNSDFEWEYELNPSGRTDEYLDRNRYTFEEAVNHLAEAIIKGKLDG